MKLSLKQLLKKKPFLLAPMDDVTDIAFRELCEEKGAAYSTTELVSVEALIRDKVFKSRFERGNLKINCVQLFGSKPQSFVEAAMKVETQADILDVNFGCPSTCVTRNDSGSMLLKDPKNVGRIIEKLVKNTTYPVTAKIRLGYTKTTYNEVAREIEDAGAELLTVHGRTAKQKYSGHADWNAIKELHEQCRIPIVGNGDVRTVQDINKYLGSHANALMIGRAAIGNPNIFTEFNTYLKDRELERIPPEKKKKEQKLLFIQYLKKLEKHNFYNVKIKIQRQASWFFRGITGAKELRIGLQKTNNIEEILKLINNF